MVKISFKTVNKLILNNPSICIVVKLVAKIRGRTKVPPHKSIAVLCDGFYP